MKLPKARTSELVEQDLGDELLIYDLTIDKAYTLNETLKIVFRACDGARDFEDLKRRHKFTDDLIHLTLGELQKNNLLEDGYASPFAEMNRREIIRQVGLASMIALPLIAGITAPTAADAASLLLANDQACTQASAGGSRECASGNCVELNSQLTCCAPNGRIPTGELYYIYLENDCSQPNRFGYFCCSGKGIYTKIGDSGNGYCTCVS